MVLNEVLCVALGLNKLFKNKYQFTQSSLGKIT